MDGRMDGLRGGWKEVPKCKKRKESVCFMARNSSSHELFPRVERSSERVIRTCEGQAERHGEARGEDRGQGMTKQSTIIHPHIIV